jgi:DivIVA domain-containing protein
MIDLASIRNASFSLTPTGYNPEEVDRFLADLADQLAESSAFADAAVAAQPAPQVPVIEQLEPAVSEAAVAERAPADLDGLQRAVERTIDAMDSFVQTELAAVREASSLEVDEIHRERERLLEEAGEAARSHLDDTRMRAEQMMQEARNEGAELRRRFESEIQSERERFEHMLSERQAEAHARASEIVSAAEDRRREADQLVANAGRVQTEVLASIEQARASLELTTTTISVPAEQSAVPSWDAEAAPQDDADSAGERDGSPAFRQDDGRSPVSLQSLLFDARGAQPAGESEPSADEPADDPGDPFDAAP